MRSLALLLFLACFSISACAQIAIENAWSRATAPGAKIAAGYMTLHNKSATADRLVGGSSAMAAKVETHVTLKDGDIMRMREVKGYALPANGSFELSPAGAHLMLVDIKKPFKEGDRIPLTLRFERAGEVRTELVVSRSRPVSEHSKH
jgi:copper(I)-binding protein